MDPRIETVTGGQQYLVNPLTGYRLKQESQEIHVNVAFLNNSSRIIELHKISQEGTISPIRLLKPGEGTFQ